MAYMKVEMPGGGTGYEDSPTVQIVCPASSWATLILKYHSACFEPNKPLAYGEITFKQVIEYRWVEFHHSYSAYGDGEVGEGFGLYQITDSKWIETMASKGSLRNYPGMRLGLHIKESDVKHFQISFDDYGTFDVICLDISIREIFE